MKITFKKISLVVFVLFLSVVLQEGWFCNGEIQDNVSIINMAKMETKEKQNLYDGIQGFVGHSWNGSDLYPDPCGWTPIQGVTCDFIDGFWYVTDLNIGLLHDNSLTCSENPEFRPQIFDFKHLKSLSFYNCFSSQNLITLPSNKWANLGSTLESLEFRLNPSLTGQIPSSFGDLRMLQSLVVIENGISGNLPLSIGNLRRLQRLVVSGNKLTGRIPDNVGNLSELLILDLSRNSLDGYIPSSIGYLKSLLKLDLSNNFLMGQIPRNLGNLKNLTLLDLRSNNLSGGFTRSIEESTSLEELILANNQIGGEITNFNWEKLQHLMILDLSNVGLSGEIPKSMAELKKLRYLGLNNNNLSGNLPTELANMPCVSSIYVNGNNLTGVLNLSDGLYRKLGKRFKAWKNPNLCYIGGIISSDDHAPLGVDPCQSDEISSSIPGVRNTPGRLQEVLINPIENSSFGSSRHGANNVIFVFVLFLMNILLWEFLVQ